jgi:transcription termination factor Rho
MTLDQNAPERAALESKDREQLHQIAAAMGVRGATRLRKAELVDAIVQAATAPSGGEASNGAAAPKPRATRARKATTTDATASDSADAGASASASNGTQSTLDVGAPPESVSSPSASVATEAAPAAAPTSTESVSSESTTSSSESSSAASDGSESTATTTTTAPTQPREGGGQREGQQSGQQGGQRQGQQGGGQQGDWNRDSFNESKRSRRRRRGRDRDRGLPAEHANERPDREPREPRQQEPVGDPVDVEGLLEIRDEGYGFLRTGGYLAGKADVYVSASQVRRFNLRKGDYVKGATRPAANNEKYPALLRVDLINDMSPDDAKARPRFEDLTPLFPDEKLRLETSPTNMTGRIVDLISPIGKGQRGLIVSPPKAGKTTIMKQIVESVETNNPEVHMMVLLVDERPEEVTDMKRHVQRGEVVASTFDRPSDEHTAVAELTIERAKRLVEMGRDVVIILDGITRLARAYNLAAPASGRILSGGVDSGALYPPKRFFGAARNIEEGGSLTILATALVETGSRMDEVIFEEFKGTGNMELRLDRRLSERRIYPSIDVEASSTRHEELLFDRVQLQQVWKLRRVLNALEGGAGLELLMDKVKTTRSNDEFLAEIAKAPVPG